MLTWLFPFDNKMSPEELIEAHEDPLDPGGYFIVHGGEKVLTDIEKMANNFIHVRYFY